MLCKCSRNNCAISGPLKSSTRISIGPCNRRGSESRSRRVQNIFVSWKIIQHRPFNCDRNLPVFNRARIEKCAINACARRTYVPTDAHRPHACALEAAFRPIADVRTIPGGVCLVPLADYQRIKATVATRPIAVILAMTDLSSYLCEYT
jgi:hypothetical protein